MAERASSVAIGHEAASRSSLTRSQRFVTLVGLGLGSSSPGPRGRNDTQEQNGEEAVGIIGSIISLAIVGLIIGGLGRLIVPGRNRIGLLSTLGVGVIGAVVGALIGGLLGLGLFSIVFELAISAGLVYLVTGRGGRSRHLVSRRSS